MTVAALSKLPTKSMVTSASFGKVIAPTTHCMSAELEQDCYPDYQKMLDSVTADDRARRERAKVANFFQADGEKDDMKK
jgi:hypothetical protein